MLGWVQVLRARAGDDAGIGHGLEAIERNIRVQARVIDDLLEMAEVLSDTFALEPRRVLVSTLLDAALDAIAPTATTRGIRLNRTVPAEEEELLVDPDRVRRVLQILLSQALGFTPRGGTIEVDLRKSGSFMEIVVTDRSSGDGPEAAHVSDEFRQGQPSSTADFGALGIGLGNAQKLVEIHGGTVRAESAGEGRGATFTVCLPSPTC
jgi:signal transduction histidine kinase